MGANARITWFVDNPMARDDDGGMNHHLEDGKKTGGPLVCTFICSGVISYFFALYWLSNPDQNPGGGPFTDSGNSYDCFSGGNATSLATVGTTQRTYNYGIKENGNSEFTWPPQAVFTDNPTVPFQYTYFDNVTKQFIYWFMWGFILQMVAILGTLIGCLAAILKKATLIKAASGLIGCGQCLGGLAWFIAGQVLRWRTQGQICSGTTAKPLNGDNVAGITEKGLLIKSGNFIQIWMIIMYSLIGCCCCLAILGAIFAKPK